MTNISPSLLRNPTGKGLVPWFILFAALLAIEYTVDYRIVRKGRDLAGLADNTLYLYRSTHSLCVNQAVYAQLDDRRVLVAIGAVAGQSVASDASTLALPPSRTEAVDAWRAIAATELAEADISAIPDDHVLLVNTGFEDGHETDGWGVGVVPTEDVGASLTHVLFARDLRRIGTPAKALGACMTRAYTP